MVSFAWVYRMNFRDYPTVKPSASYQVLNSDTEFLIFQRKVRIQETVYGMIVVLGCLALGALAIWHLGYN